MSVKGSQARAAAARTVDAVLTHGLSLATCLPAQLRTLAEGRDRALAQELAYGCLRHAPRLAWYSQRLLHRPIAGKDGDLKALILIGLYQLDRLGTPSHVAVSTTVEACRALGKPWARGLVNAVLRQYLRRHEELAPAADLDPEARYSHPRWLIEAIERSWPRQWQAILAANNARPPMTLRVNAARIDREAYLARLAEAGIAAAPTLYCAQGLRLGSPTDVDKLPGFAEGWVSVQDEAAQLAAGLLDPRPGLRVLDACAAPGGKVAHLREICPPLAELVAVEMQAQRAGSLRATLSRLGIEATPITADAGRPAEWWDGRPFDRILLDAPCTATGVIRRHPDIKSLRRPADVAKTAAEQTRLLDALWPLLGKDGKLLYATCSILPEENQEQVARFLTRHEDARAAEIEAAWGQPVPPGRQILPGESQMDGFYYALLCKQS